VAKRIILGELANLLFESGEFLAQGSSGAQHQPCRVQHEVAVCQSLNADFELAARDCADLEANSGNATA